jgi:hypothetical protein
MTHSDLIAACAAIASDVAHVDATILDFADAAYSRAFLTTNENACFVDAASAFVVAIMLAACGWPT